MPYFGNYFCTNWTLLNVDFAYFVYSYQSGCIISEHWFTDIFFICSLKRLSLLNVVLWFMVFSFSWGLWYSQIMCQICFVSFSNLMLLFFFSNLMLQAIQLWSIIEIIQFLWASICFLCVCSTSLFHDCSLEQILILFLYINLYIVLYHGKGLAKLW